LTSSGAFFSDFKHLYQTTPFLNKTGPLWNWMLDSRCITLKTELFKGNVLALFKNMDQFFLLQITKISLQIYHL